MSKFTVVSTFSGCGGSSLGYQMAGGKILLAVECDDNAVTTYRLNFPDTQLYHGDIAELSVEEALSRTGLKPGDLDILDGSPPCQGFSMAGRREFYDDRNQLFREYARLLRGLKPKTCVMENVSGMVKGNMKIMFAEILSDLKACGYKVSAKLMNAKYYGVPQSRERMIFIGVRDDLGIQPSHPLGSDRLVMPRKLDSRPAMYSVTRYEDELCSERKPVGTITKTNRKFWSPNEEFWIKSYAYAGSFPEWFAFRTFADAKSRIGNSVPPLFMKAIAAHVYQELLSKVHSNHASRN